MNTKNTKINQLSASSRKRVTRRLVARYLLLLWWHDNARTAARLEEADGLLEEAARWDAEADALLAEARALDAAM